MATEIKNKKASYQYELQDKVTAGLILTGPEIKSIRLNQASINEAYCRFEKDELYIHNMYIAEYANRGYAEHEPRRKRKLLLNRHELNKLQRKLKNVGFTIIPTRLYIDKTGWAKIVIALARGKKQHDKRQDLKKKDIERDLDRNT